ncbi:NAD(P)-dependent oxidoreductase [Paracoccus sediminilitoris]|uniref:NAD(P)-dependent oxidoreductase n=1 Tax=Paracoccus sediminilitoris TaxID=2202419 RepID=UPI000DBA7456
MLQRALLVNTARGGRMDEAPIAVAQTSNQLGGAATKAVLQEPSNSKNLLLAVPNAVLSPHCGGRFQGNLSRIVRYWSDIIIAHASGAKIDPACILPAELITAKSEGVLSTESTPAIHERQPFRSAGIRASGRF